MYELTLASYELQTIHSFRWEFISNPHLYSFIEFSVTTLLCTLILPMPQLQAKYLMTSQSWSCRELLIPNFSTRVLILHTF